MGGAKFRLVHLEKGNDLFCPQAEWRDFLSLTWCRLGTTGLSVKQSTEYPTWCDGTFIIAITESPTSMAI